MAIRVSPRWKTYEKPLQVRKPGKYAVLTKTVPLPRRGEALASLERQAAVAEATGQVPDGYAALGNALVDAVAAGVISREKAIALLERCARGQLDDPRAIAADLREKTAKKRPQFAAERDAERSARARATRAVAARAAADALDFEADGTSQNAYAIAAAGDGVYRPANGGAPVVLGAVAPDAFFDACDDEHAPRYDDAAPNLLESKVATAVYELGESPPTLQHEDCKDELHFVRACDAEERGLRCSKCGAAGDKLYAHGDFALCRACALKGAGVMVDPGARRMWFSQMIQFVGSRAVPLPKSQPLLAQILKVLQAHPGIAVRFEGHVNGLCGLGCDGSGPCPSGGSMCARCPGGAMGLSTARADAVKQFILACGIESTRRRPTTRL